MAKKKKPKQKTWFGMPVDWDTQKPFKNLWNKEDDRILLPKGFGVGWTINLHAVLKSVGLVRKK